MLWPNEVRMTLNDPPTPSPVNPAKSLQELEERIQQRKDLKVVKKWYVTLDGLADDMDLEPGEKARLFQVCYSRFESLPEAQHLLTFPVSNGDVKS